MAIGQQEYLEMLIQDRDDLGNLIQRLEENEGDNIVFLHGFVGYDTLKSKCELRDQRLKDSFLTWIRHEKAYLEVLIDLVKSQMYW